MQLEEHFGIGPEKIKDITYDYGGPNGCQRKFVITPDIVYVYHQVGCQWVIKYNLSR